MPSIDTIIVVMLAGFALSASPGPSMLYVLSRSLGQDRNAGLASAAGLAMGGVVHAIAAAVGLSALLTYYPAVYRIVTVLGAGYLVYLGVQMYLSRNDRMGEAQAVTRQPLRKIFMQGVVVEVLNPKTALFFIAFLPQFVNQSVTPVMLQVLVLGMLIPLTAIPSDLVVAFTGGTLARHISRNARVRSALNCLGAVFLVGLGLQIFLSWAPAG